MGNTEYGYDQLSRLTKATPDQGLQALGLPAEQYSYDAVHNRTSSQHQAGAWSYNKDNQLTQYPKLTPFKAGETAIETSVTYTLQGHTAKETSAQGEKNYSYNAAERLTSYSSTLAGQANTETEALYRYDPFGRRIGKVVTKPGAAADITYYLYSDIGLLAEIDNQGALRRAYAFKPHKTQTLWSTDPIWQADLNVGPTPSLATGATFHYLQTDHLGTPVISVTKAGALSWKALSEAFGATGVLQGQSSTTMNLRFPGQYFDKEMGSHYNYRRDYKPSFARYLESDPKGLNGGVNLYVYAKNAPHNFIDPEGGIPIPTKRVPKDEPVGNGCGDASSDKYIPDAFIGYDFSIPCRKHDICYGTCGNPKAMCDSKFLNDLLWQCFRPRPEIVMAIANPSLIGDCLFVAASYYQAVLIFGLKPYCAAQKKACPDCQPIPGCDQ